MDNYEPDLLNRVNARIHEAVDEQALVGGGGEAQVPLAAAVGEISDEFQNLALLGM